MTTKLYGGDKRLYTAAEARRIDIERGGEGKIRAEHWANGCAIYFDDTSKAWINEKDNTSGWSGWSSHRNLTTEIWLPLTASLEASTPEPEPIVLDYLVLVDANERIKQLEKENESLLAERNRLREWYEDYYTKQPTIEQLQEVLQNALNSREDLKKELAEATQNYHEILADHGELTRQFDELTEKARWKSCKDEKPEHCKEIVFMNDRYILGTGSYSFAPNSIGWWLNLPLVTNGELLGVKLADEQVETWTWKYEADL